MDCYIFGAGEESLPTVCPPRKEVLVIAADGGYGAACRVFDAPDLAVGDFDSLGYIPDGVETLRHPPEKDETDLFLAVRAGIERGADRFLVYGGLGARLDHTVANLQVLGYLAERGIECYFFGADGGAVTAISDGAKLEFSSAYVGTVSVLAFSGAASGVTLSGLKYPLADAALSATFPLGISNEFLGTAASVSVKAGTLLVFFPALKNSCLPAKTALDANKTLQRGGA